MLRRSLSVVLFVVVCLCASSVFSAENEYTVVVANPNVPASVDIANYYASVRGVPNILYLDVPLDAMSSDYQMLKGGYAEFDTYIRQPVKSYLQDKPILYVVLTYGIPVKAVIDPINTKTMCVDSGLAGDFPLNEFFDGPYHFSNCYGQYIVTRLDGPTPEVAKALVDRAVAGESWWSSGTCYFDAGGPYAVGDMWITDAYIDSVALGYDSVLETSPSLIQSFPDCQFYYGWYSGAFNGTFSWNPGGVGIHIYSFSASDIRDPRGWAAGLLASGAACTAGAVNEPYLDYYVCPDLFVKHFFRGDNFGEAFYKSISMIRWMMVAIGDPLYNPTDPNPADPVDTTPPSAPGTPLPVHLKYTNQPYVTLQWRPAIDDTGLRNYHLYLGRSSGVYDIVSADIGVTRSWTSDIPLRDGVYYTALYAEDMAGRASPLSAEGVFTVDTVLPVIYDVTVRRSKVSWQTNELTQGHLEFPDGSTKYGSGSWSTRWTITATSLPCYIVAMDKARNTTKVLCTETSGPKPKRGR